MIIIFFIVGEMYFLMLDVIFVLIVFVKYCLIKLFNMGNS